MDADQTSRRANTNLSGLLCSRHDISPAPLPPVEVLSLCRPSQMRCHH
jgi:hypothetical protein